MDYMMVKNLVIFVTEGNGPKQFELPYGVSATPDGKIYVADAGNHYIVQMDDMTGKNWTSLGNNTPGIPTPSYTKKQQWFLPFDVFVDSAGKIYVADTTNNRITRMDDMTGKNWITFGAGGSGTNQFKFPRTVFIR
jgi:DNA-binding beta-propeller fold protein YncE